MIALAVTVGGFGVAILEIIKLALAKRLAIDQTLVGGWSRLSGSSCDPGWLICHNAVD
jgi:hypothetical protein